MDAFIVSSYVKKSLRRKKLEHAAFLVNPSTSRVDTSTTNNNFVAVADNSLVDNSITDNSMNDNSMMEDNYRFADNRDNSDNSEKVYANTDNSSNITVNNIKVTNVKSDKVALPPVHMHQTQLIEENEDVEEDDYEEYNNNKANNISTITFLLMLIINSYAAYLSWECNSKKDYPLVLKIVFSFFAFMFGSLYLLYYILFRFDDCNQF